MRQGVRREPSEFSATELSGHSFSHPPPCQERYSASTHVKRLGDPIYASKNVIYSHSCLLEWTFSSASNWPPLCSYWVDSHQSNPGRCFQIPCIEGGARVFLLFGASTHPVGGRSFPPRFEYVSFAHLHLTTIAAQFCSFRRN